MEEDCGLTAGNGYGWLGAAEEGLDRALVAGLMLNEALGACAWPPGAPARNRALKARVQEALLTGLSGQISLDRFHALIHTLEQAFPFYLPIISALLPSPAQSPAGAPEPSVHAPAPAGAGRAVDSDRLAAAIGRLGVVLPRRAHSKLSGGKLRDFLCRTRGRWFRLADLQQHFGIDRKTAWEYVQKFLAAGLLIRNSGRAAAARYALQERFLRVQAAAIRETAAALLSHLPPRLAPLLADRVIASGGEPFWEIEWRDLLPASSHQATMELLLASGSLLEAVSCPDSENRLLRLKPCWLKTPVAAA